MFLTGPTVVKTVTGEDVSQEDLGRIGSLYQERRDSLRSGIRGRAIAIVRKLLGYIPQNNLEETPRLLHAQTPSIVLKTNSTTSYLTARNAATTCMT